MSKAETLHVEASELKGNTCHVCGGNIVTDGADRDGEGELLAWQGHCERCDQDYEIFND